MQARRRNFSRERRQSRRTKDYALAVDCAGVADARTRRSQLVTVGGVVQVFSERAHLPPPRRQWRPAQYRLPLLRVSATSTTNSSAAAWLYSRTTSRRPSAAGLKPSELVCWSTSSA